MALQSQAWSPATPMPMAESSLYRQRLEVIAEKRRLQEQIRAARRELEEEKLRVERLKRKSLRERWLMDGAAEGPQQPEDLGSKDPQSPEGQAQARIRNLEDSLFTLQSELQLLQSASTGAQHKPLGRLTWRRQSHRPVSQPTMEAGLAGQSEPDKRASLPTGLVGASPEVPSEPQEEAAGVLPPQRQVPGAVGTSPEANGPCPGPSPGREQEWSLGAAAAEQGVVEAKGAGVVEVVWEGLRAPEDCATGSLGLELEARVEEVVLEAIGDRQGAGSTELPAWVKEDRGVAEVVWEGLGGTESQAGGEVGPEATLTSSPGLRPRLQGDASQEGEGAPRGSPEGEGQGGSGGEEGSFIWVERATLSEDWEELLMEGLEGPVVTEGGGQEAWEGGRRRAEESPGAGGEESEAKPGTGRDTAVNASEGPQQPEGGGGEGEGEAEEPLGTEIKDGEGPLRAEEDRGQEKPEAEERAEDPSRVERKEVGGPLGTEKERREEKQAAQKEEEEALGVEGKGGEEVPGAEREGGEEAWGAEREGEEVSQVQRRGGEEASGAQKTQGSEEELSSGGQRESGERTESQGEVSEAGATLGVKQEPGPGEGPRPLEKQGATLEEEAGQLRTPAESQGPPGDTMPLLRASPAPQQPTERQPLLQRGRPRANPSAHPAPTYAPARQPEPAAPAEGEEARGPKQKTCQCCALM
ncbi:Hypothetical predicted protein [Marmota monax]|uniref:Paralemmin-3 n=1 Tax=Marmota monax TaxID=9995 RepID=A0A5E4AA40_MARMO|nr:Hypothetical predicted protein [Marmota monax]